MDILLSLRGDSAQRLEEGWQMSREPITRLGCEGGVSGEGK